MKLYWVALLDDADWIVGAYLTRAAGESEALAAAMEAGAPPGAGYAKAYELKTDLMAVLLDFSVEPFVDRMLSADEAVVLARRIGDCAAS